MDDARPRRAADRRPGAAAAEKGMDQGAGVVPWRRMDDHPGGLVDDRDVFVLVDDVERYLLRPGHHDVGLGNLKLDYVPGGNAVRGVGRVAVDEDQVAFDQPRRRRPAEFWSLLGEEAIEPRGRRRRDQLVGLRRRR